MEQLIPLFSILLVLWAGQFLFFFLFFRRRTTPERILGDLRVEVDKLIAEIDAATDRDATLVEDRIRSLREILADTDRRISTYARERDRKTEAERLYEELGRRPRPTVAAAPPSQVPSLRADVSTPAQVMSGQGAAPGAVPESAPGAAPESAHEAEPQAAPQATSARSATVRHGAEFVGSHGAPLSERVLELHRAGFSAELIASRLGTTVGEAELVIALAQRKESSESGTPSTYSGDAQ